MQRYILPYPPSLNRLYRTVRSRVYKTRVWRSWANDASAAIMAQLGADRPPMSAHPIAVVVAVGRPDARRRDLDNLTKVVFDLLQTKIAGQRIIKDDSLIHCYQVYWADLTGIAVTLQEINGMQGLPFFNKRG